MRKLTTSNVLTAAALLALGAVSMAFLGGKVVGALVELFMGWL